jgi:hypothetical protein
MEKNNNKIFIQIASYRDPELIHTLNNCIENSDNPENLNFGICWQHDENEDLSKYLNDKRFKIISIHYSQSKGCCWARHKVQQLYDNEEYTLQLDSHHRFVKGWDTILKNMHSQLKQKGVSKPLITAYLPSYDPENDPANRSNIPWKIVFKEITEDKQVLFIPSNINKHYLLKQPIGARFYSAHFTFADGKFVTEVPHDPELYFTGEEMSITVRAYTHGYTLFHPHIIIAWHEYTRKNRTKHWDDDKEWWQKDLHSKNHYLSIFTNKGKYGIGSERTIEDYIKYSGINFLDRNNNTNTFTYDDDKIETSNETSNVNNNETSNVNNNETSNVNNNETSNVNNNETNNVNNTTTNVNNTTSNVNNEINTTKIYQEINESWSKWIKENIDLGISGDIIKQILLNANFNPEYVKLIHIPEKSQNEIIKI